MTPRVAVTSVGLDSPSLCPWSDRGTVKFDLIVTEFGWFRRPAVEVWDSACWLWSSRFWLMTLNMWSAPVVWVAGDLYGFCS